MKQSQTSTSISPWLKPALLAVVAVIVTAGCKTQAITPPGGIPTPVPMPSGGLPIPGGGESSDGGGGSSGGGSESSGDGDSSGAGGSSGGGGSTGVGLPTGGDGSGGGSSGTSGGVGSVPQVEMPGGFPGGGGDGDGDGDADADGDADSDSNSDCGETGELPGGVGGMGQAGECLGGGGAASDSDSETASGSGSGTGTGGAGGTGQFPAESDAERAERLGRELEESVGGFDEVLMEEQREVAAVGRSTAGFGGGSGGGGAGGISLGEQSGGSVSIANPSGPNRESPIAGMTDDEIRERTPEDIPVAVDDDIISRQLREAALAEEDPELRERLWAEYRKYQGL